MVLNITADMPVVVQLSKAPIDGRVKTRMQPVLTEQQSTALHKEMTRHTVEQLSMSDQWRHQVWVSEMHSFFNDLAAQFPIDLKMQPLGDLGQRLIAISTAHFSSRSIEYANTKLEIENQDLTGFGRPPLVIIGSDCPGLDEHCIWQLFEALECYDLAIIPAFDGGYVAIAVNAHYPSLFKAVEWGSDGVLRQTLQNAQRLGLNSMVLTALPDIDRPDDLKYLAELGLTY